MRDVPSTSGAARTVATERRIGRLLIAVTYLSVALLAIGLVLMIADGIAPTSGGPRLDLGGLARGVAALEPAGFLWLGLLAVVAAPIGRVIVAGVAYAGEADWLMVGISVAILVVIAVGVASAALVAA
jgi:uncharacterized membrane protein